MNRLSFLPEKPPDIVLWLLAIASFFLTIFGIIIAFATYDEGATVKQQEKQLNTLSLIAGRTNDQLVKSQNQIDTLHVELNELRQLNGVVLSQLDILKLGRQHQVADSLTKYNADKMIFGSFQNSLILTFLEVSGEPPPPLKDDYESLPQYKVHFKKLFQDQLQLTDIMLKNAYVLADPVLAKYFIMYRDTMADASDDFDDGYEEAIRGSKAYLCLVNAFYAAIINKDKFSKKTQNEFSKLAFDCIIAR